MTKLISNDHVLGGNPPESMQTITYYDAIAI